MPIPNTEVKLMYAEDSCRVTGRENRYRKHKTSYESRRFFIAQVPKIVALTQSLNRKIGAYSVPQDLARYPYIYAG